MLKNFYFAKLLKNKRIREKLFFFQTFHNKYQRKILENFYLVLFFGKYKMSVKLGTHSGRFHTDEILAIVMLMYLPQYKNAEIIRTRDPRVLETCDVVVDVGGVYDHSKKRYDHHQKTFKDTLDDKHDIRLSSAGLIYKHYGDEILELGFGITDKTKRKRIYDRLYTHFIEAVDAVDNGVNQFDGEAKYEVNTTLQNRVNNCNPNFLEDNPDENAYFKKAMVIVKDDFTDCVHYLRDVWYVAKSIVQKAFETRFECHPSGRVLLLEKNCPYWDHLYEIEQENNIGEFVYYVLYFDKNKNYRCGAVSKVKQQFTSRMPFSKKCRGLQEKELEEVSTIKGLSFVHYTGFTSGGKSKDSLLKLVELTLKENNIKW